MSEAKEKHIYIGAPAAFKLELAMQHIAKAFVDGSCYVVGSVLKRPDWRDVDVRMILSDEDFDKEFPNTLKDGTWEFNPRWCLIVISLSAWLKDQTGLPIDFQIQPQTHANKIHSGQRNAVGLIFTHHKPKLNSGDTA